MEFETNNFANHNVHKSNVIYKAEGHNHTSRHISRMAQLLRFSRVVRLE